MELTLWKAEQPLLGMELYEKEVQKDKNLFTKNLQTKVLLILDLKPFTYVKGKHSLDREFQGLAVREKKLLT